MVELLKKFVKAKAELSKIFKENIEILFKTFEAQETDELSLIKLYFISSLDVQANTGIFSDEESKDTVYETALKIVIKKFEERLTEYAEPVSDKSDLRIDIERVLRFEQKFSFLLDSYCTETLWSNLKKICQKLESLIELDLDAKPFKYFKKCIENIVCEDAKSIITNTETGTKERIKQAFCSYFIKNNNITKVKDILQTIFIIIEKNKEILGSLYEKDKIKEFVDEVTKVIIEQLKRLIKDQIDSSLKSVIEDKDNILNKQAISYHGSNTNKLCEFHRTRRNIEGKIQSLINIIVDLVSLLKTNVILSFTK